MKPLRNALLSNLSKRNRSWRPREVSLSGMEGNLSTGILSAKRPFQEGRRSAKPQYSSWKQWRLPRPRIRKLKQLGVRPEEAYSHGNSRKGPWRMAKSLAISMAMPNEWLDDLGLFSLSKRWTELAPLRRTAQSPINTDGSAC